MGRLEEGLVLTSIPVNGIHSRVLIARPGRESIRKWSFP